ncbi:MAG: ferrous iron transport protein B [bacterium]|nr:MAG: ferrous iron transport protein B [bacterium]
MKFLSAIGKRKTTPQCHGPAGEDIEGLQKIVIVGNPNVGKSLLFNRLTGMYVTVSNYPGTTVTVDKGKCKINGRDFGVIDLPGMYSLIPITEEERVAKLMLLEEKPKIILHVIDAKNLERMLPLTLQLIEAGLPVILVINMMDEAEGLGISIDFNDLEGKLGIPVVPIIATAGKGIDQLIRKIDQYVPVLDKFQTSYQKGIESSIKEIESFLKNSYPISKRSVSLLLLQEDEDMQRLVKQKESKDYDQIDGIVKRTSRKYGYPLNYIIKIRLQNEVRKITSSSLVAVPLKTGGFFVGVLGAGKLVNLIEGTIFGEKINPVITRFVMSNVPYRPIQDLIVGEYGIITLGITYAVAIILPIVGTFFLVFSVIEDSGYLPRLSMLADRVFKKIGLSGRAVIPMVLGLGCSTMATMVTRTQETKRERVISTLLLALAVPCSAQLGVIFAILAGHPLALFIWVVVVLLNFILIGFLAARILPGEKPSFYMELPPLRLPKISNVLIKTYSRMVWYFKEVFPLFIIVSVLIWISQLTGILHVITNALEPVVNLVGLPDETARVFLFGFFRRDYGAAGLYSMQNALTGIQLTVAAVILTLFVPCVAQFMMMIKERGIKTAALIFTFVLFFAFGVGFVLNQALVALGVQL